MNHSLRELGKLYTYIFVHAYVLCMYSAHASFVGPCIYDPESIQVKTDCSL